MNFNFYSKLTDTLPTKSVPLDNLVELIKSGEQKDLIYTLRNTPKTNASYEVIKKSLPAVTLNASFSTSRSIANFQSTTGMIFFDLDQKDLTGDQSLASIVDYLKTLSYVNAIWRSCGGKGIGFLVKVNPTYDYKRFREYWKIIKESLNLPLDEACKNINRLTFLTHDEDVYYNETAKEFTFTPEAIEANCQNNNSFLSRNLPIYENEDDDDIPACYTTQFRMPEEKRHLDYIIIPEGVEVCNIWLGKRKSVPEGERNTWLYKNAIKYLYNFPSISYRCLYNRIKFNNEIYCARPLAETEIEKLVLNVYQAHKAGKLEYPVTKKYIQLNYLELITLTAKRKALGRALGELAKIKNQSIPKLVAAYNELKEKDINPTYINLMLTTSLSRRTVARYIHQVKEIVAHLEDTGELKNHESESIYYGELNRFNIRLNDNELKIERSTFNNIEP